MNYLTSFLKTEKIENLQLSTDIVDTNTLISAIDSLDNRLSDFNIAPEIMTKETVVDTLSAIITRFGGNNNIDSI